ncbi:MAG: alkaline phosphatase family protein [Oscillospiraceae bacterium]|jgi:hypothetical protein|nr:alkaline phosphatase family protein [Oscillospiraceae bacterium]
MLKPNPQYDASIVSLMNSIRKDFGIRTFHGTLPQADELLADGKYKNVVLLIWDGLGMNILEQHLKPNAFLRKNLVADISSVFPPTTAAAIPAFKSGLRPAETGWFGWSQYLEEVGRTAVLFKSKDQGTGEKIPGYDGALPILPYPTVEGDINHTSNARGWTLNSFKSQDGGIVYKNYRDMLRKIRENCKKDGRQYIYCYSSQPDHEIHFCGTEHKTVRRTVRQAQRVSKRLSKKLKDTLLFIVADHGLIDCAHHHVVQNNDFAATLEYVAEFDARVLGCRPKKGMEDEFLRQAKRLCGDGARIATKQEAIDEGWFGNDPGVSNEILDRRLPPYLILAQEYHAFTWKNYPQKWNHGVHSGCMEEEMRVPLIAVSR